MQALPRPLLTRQGRIVADYEAMYGVNDNSVVQECLSRASSPCNIDVLEPRDRLQSLISTSPQVSDEEKSELIEDLAELPAEDMDRLQGRILNQIRLAAIMWWERKLEQVVTSTEAPPLYDPLTRRPVAFIEDHWGRHLKRGVLSQEFLHDYDPKLYRAIINYAPKHPEEEWDRRVPSRQRRTDRIIELLTEHGPFSAAEINRMFRAIERREIRSNGDASAVDPEAAATADEVAPPLTSPVAAMIERFAGEGASRPSTIVDAVRGDTSLARLLKSQIEAKGYVLPENWPFPTWRRDRLAEDTPPDFIKRHYGHLIETGLLRSEIGFDPQLYSALSVWLQQSDPSTGKRNELPPDCRLLKRRDFTDAIARENAIDPERPVTAEAARVWRTRLAIQKRENNRYRKLLY